MLARYGSAEPRRILVRCACRLFLTALGCVVGAMAQGAGPPKQISALVEQLRSSDSNRVRSAAYELCQFGGEAAPAVAGLESLLRHADVEVRRVAVYTLGCIGPPAIPAANRIALRVRDESPAVRQAAVEALGRLGSNVPETAIRALTDALSDEDPQVQRRAAFTLASLESYPIAAVSVLTKLLTDNDSEVRRASAYALAAFGSDAHEAVPKLIDLLRDNRTELRRVAAYALGRIGASAQEAMPALTKTLRDPSPPVRREAAEALQRIAGQDALPGLLTGLEDTDTNVRRTSAEALGDMGLGGRTSLPLLIKALEDTDPEVRRTAAGAIARIAGALKTSTEWTYISVLQEALVALNRARSQVPEGTLNRALRAVRTAIDVMRARRSDSKIALLLEWLHKPWVAALAMLSAAYAVWLLILSLVVLRRFPLKLIDWNEAVEKYADFTLPALLGGVKLPVARVLLIGFFHLHDRVLEAWVETRVDRVYKHLQNRDTFKVRALYVPLPVVLNGQQLSCLEAKNLRATCSRQRWYVHIGGEGGAGKTTLACQLAVWCLALDNSERLMGDRRSLPVLIEPGLGFDVRKNVQAFKRAVRGQLQISIDAAEPISEPLFERLLRSRRVVVILDGLSEMVNDADAADESRARFDNPDFPVNALVVTARNTGERPEQPDAAILPLRLDTKHLSPFMTTYFSEGGLNLPDSKVYEACTRLAEMVGADRGITPLLAKLYAQEFVDASRRGTPTANLPGTIPDLMLGYLNNLNRDRRPLDPDNPLVHRAVGIAAWHCISGTFRPGRARKQDVAGHFERDRLGPSLLQYLETQLNVIRTVGAAEIDIQFMLDPIAEYMASWHLVSLCAGDRKSWSQALADLDGAPGAPAAIRDFLVALRDCCLARRTEFSVPAGVIAELDQRIEQAREYIAP